MIESGFRPNEVEINTIKYDSGHHFEFQGPNIGLRVITGPSRHFANYFLEVRTSLFLPNSTLGTRRHRYLNFKEDEVAGMVYEFAKDFHSIQVYPTMVTRPGYENKGLASTLSKMGDPVLRITTELYQDLLGDFPIEIEVQDFAHTHEGQPSTWTHQAVEKKGYTREGNSNIYKRRFR